MKKSGFTLIELVVVMVVLGTLLAISSIAYSKVSEDASDQIYTSALRTIKSSIVLFQYDHLGALPESFDELKGTQPNDKNYLEGIQHFVDDDEDDYEYAFNKTTVEEVSSVTITLTKISTSETMKQYIIE